MVVQQERREGTDTFNKDEVLDELLLYILAGNDTTTASLSWLVKYMPQDFAIQQRLYDEICEAFGNNLTNPGSIVHEVINDIKRMPVLEAVTVETLRLAVVGGGLTRHYDDVVLGRHIPKGTDMIVLAGFIGRSESEWGSDAKQWRPSRWLRPDGSFNRNAGYAGDPFGMGHRSCFGQRLAVRVLT
ncbi:hypothetical protein FRC07_005757 [Ceratobasidium sp. 392]|nr:hypothetical protein FRC07_005757 [Ceratobasidium sp. 392]